MIKSRRKLNADMFPDDDPIPYVVRLDAKGEPQAVLKADADRVDSAIAKIKRLQQEVELYLQEIAALKEQLSRK